MIDCLILGDSIAKGISDIRRECVAYVKSGINSQDWNDKYINNIVPSKTTIISLGSNDLAKLNTEREVTLLRKRVESDRVFWIIPAIKPAKQSVIQEVAKVFGDTLIVIPDLSPDQVHPTYRGYKHLGEITK
jgi:hypothetical protein